MSTPEEPSVAEFLRTYEGAPAIAALRQAIAAQGRSIDDVAEVSGRNFHYESKPVEKDGKRWAAYERVPVVFWKAIFTDRTRIALWWHNGRQESLTYEQAKAMLDRSRLEFSDRQFLEGYVPQ